MITETILGAFQGAVTLLLGLLPDIPDIPSEVEAGISTFIDLIGQTVGVIAYIYTPTILLLVFGILIAIINFDAIYKFVLWVLHKVRG